MQLDFHYYATYCAAYLAGYSHEDSQDIAYSAQFVDECSRTLLGKLQAPRSAATTQLQLEMMDARTDIVGLQDITRIWASFHFLPGDLKARPERRCSRRYLNKYRLICQPNGELLADTVRLAKGRGLRHAGLAMHILADTWAHRNFAGTPSLVINNVDRSFCEIIDDEEGRCSERPVRFNHNPTSPDDPEAGRYTNSVYQWDENSIMNLGHGRAGHFPDYSWAKYRYMPAWGGYREILKDNLYDYMCAFCQMVYALKYLRGEYDEFETGRYDLETVEPWADEIGEIIHKRQLNAEAEWKALGEKLSGRSIEDFALEKYQEEYISAAEEDKNKTFIGRFILAAMSQKSMVTGRIFASGNLLAGYAIDYSRKGFGGIREFRKLVQEYAENTISDIRKDD